MIRAVPTRRFPDGPLEPAAATAAAPAPARPAASGPRRRWARRHAARRSVRHRADRLREVQRVEGSGPAGIPLRWLLVDVLECASPLLFDAERHRVRQVFFEELGRSDHPLVAVALHPREKFLEAERGFARPLTFDGAGGHDLREQY